MSLNIYRKIQSVAKEESTGIGNLIPHFTRVTDVDDSPDLTDVHPRDRKDMDLHFISVDEKLFPRTFEICKTVDGFINASIIAFGPQSQLYPHVDTVDLEPYSEINWLSVYIGIYVPSYDSKKVGLKIDEKVFDHKDIIVFDTQIPHSAWNWTNEWWVSIRLAVLKTGSI